MSTKEILELALKLQPQERYKLVEGLMRSLDEPDTKIDELWIQEAEARLKEYRAGKLEVVAFDAIFKSDK